MEVVLGEQETAQNIFFNKYYPVEYLAYLYKINSKDFIFGFSTEYVNTSFITLSAFANSWREEFNITYENAYDFEPTGGYYSAYGIYDTLAQCDIIKIENGIYFFYYLGSITNSGIYNYIFALYEINSKEHFYIRVFNSFPNTDDHKFEFSKGVDKNLIVKEFLENKIKLVFINVEVKTDEKEFYSSYDLWMKNNGSLYNNLNKSDGYYQIKFVGVDENTFKNELAESDNLFSNDEFEIYSRFKGPLYLFSKEHKTYTIIWYPESSYDWIVSCRYENNNLYIFPQLRTFYYVINLITKKIRKVNDDSL